MKYKVSFRAKTLSLHMKKLHVVLTSEKITIAIAT